MKLQATYELMRPPTYEMERRRPIARKAFGNLRSDGPDFAQADIDGCPQAPLPQGHHTEEGQPQ
jgi:hypothetical protein